MFVVVVYCYILYVYLQIFFVIFFDVCVILFFVCLFFFFKQKTAYEMRISDWSSDVCSSDLHRAGKLLKIVGDLVIVGALGGEDVPHGAEAGREIGRASCRERVCQYV